MALWDEQSTLLLESLDHRAAINLVHYCKTLRQLKEATWLLTEK
jgi:hypothetical protein